MSKTAIKIGLIAGWAVAISVFVVLEHKARASTCDVLVEMLTGAQDACPDWNVTVFLKADATKDHENDVRITLRGLETAERAVYVSKDAALHEFGRQHRNNPELVRSVDPESLTASFRVWLKDGARPEPVVQALKGNEAVAAVTPVKIRGSDHDLAAGWQRAS